MVGSTETASSISNLVDVVVLLLIHILVLITVVTILISILVSLITMVIHYQAAACRMEKSADPLGS